MTIISSVTTLMLKNILEMRINHFGLPTIIIIDYTACMNIMIVVTNKIKYKNDKITIYLTFPLNTSNTFVS